MTDQTICNPIDLPYKLQNMTLGPKRFTCREAADPSIILFKDRYFLFPSMSGGFWHSLNLVDWTFVATPTLPIYDYAPDVHIVDGQMIVCASRPSICNFYRSPDPLSGQWDELPGTFAFWDPALFQDDDGRLYLYQGCSARKPINGVELDRRTFRPLGEPVTLIESDTSVRGWERKGENHQGQKPGLGGAIIGLLGGTGAFIEGAWMTKHAGCYYLQYSAPGTELNTYADGYYVGESPLGPFTYSPHSPFSFKPAGFITGAGHGSTFQDRHGNWWHTASMRISKAYMFERRLGIFPAGFDEDGVLFCNQEFADYPFPIPDRPIDPRSIVPPWMLLSWRCSVTASSEAPGHPATLAVNEDIRSWWTPADDRTGHWITLDLGEGATINAIQVNLAEHRMKAPKRPRAEMHRTAAIWKRHIELGEHPTEIYLETSPDGRNWTLLTDTRGQSDGRTHYYLALTVPSRHRYVRLTGFEQPFGATLAVSGLRVFGRRDGSAPAATCASATRVGPLDADIRWTAVPDADGYNVRSGLQPHKLYSSWMVRNATELRLSLLNAGEDYWVAVDSFNGSGVTRGEAIHVSTT